MLTDQDIDKLTSLLASKKDVEEFKKILLNIKQIAEKVGLNLATE